MLPKQLVRAIGYKGVYPEANESIAASAPSPPSQPISRVDTPDPDIQDISEHHYIPRTTPRPPISSTPSGRGTPNAGMNMMDMFGAPPAGGMDGNEDPMMKLMQQMMGGASGEGNSQFPPGLAEMFSGTTGGMPGQPQQQAASSSAYLWRIVHAIFSLSLALYVVLTTPFTGTKAARSASVYSLEGENFGQRLFYLFATVEVVLQSSRYFLEKGQLAPSGIMGTLAQFLPMPYAGWIKVAGRYGVIYTTVVADAMVVVFVLGAMAWWKGGVMETR